MSVKVEPFLEWLNAQAVDANGFVRLNVTRQKADPAKWSFSLDTWKKQEAGPEAPADENLPF
jgi:hypothetical protein